MPPPFASVFSFVRYVVNATADSARAATITEAKGGGILTFLVLLDTPESMIRDAERTLRGRYKKNEIVVRGPIVFQDGRYTLVSSVLKTASVGTATADAGAGATPTEHAVIATGRAPVLEGNRLALSFDLDPAHASLLMPGF